jgi:exodeoxyribonuclease-5
MDYLTLTNIIKKQLAFEPTRQQNELIDLLAQFCCMPTETKSFILKGFAGTGKTSIVSGLIMAMKALGQNTVLLAPTGRAAKVLSNYSNHSAYSIHKVIYRQKSAGDFTFNVNYNSHKNTLFIVDEASMIANQSGMGVEFGSGRLLDDLVEYVYSGDNCSMILVGDTAQLLPIGQNSSPALNKSIIEGYGLEVMEYQLTQVIRQAGESGILFNATKIRQAIENEPFTPIKLNPNFDDVKVVSGENLVEELENSFANAGEENTIILTYSNKRAVLYNRGVRGQVMMKEDELSRGDYLIVTKNNYYWSKQYDNLDFIANGDIAEIMRVGKHYELYGARFADLTLRLIDYDVEVTARILIDSLYTETPAAQNALNQNVMNAIAEDYADIGDKRKFWKEMQNNEFYNALQVKFAYAITGHKSQGGSWDHVYIDQGYITEEMITREYYQWLYTAITRAREKVFLVNFSKYFLK